MAELNAHSERMVFIVNCKVKDTESFKTWTKDRAAKYVYDLKEENSISYEWHISEDGTEATLIEAFVDSDGMMVRLANHGASPVVLYSLTSSCRDCSCIITINAAKILCLSPCKEHRLMETVSEA